MKCPSCLSPRIETLDSRRNKEKGYVRRRRKCNNPDCGNRFTTYEIAFEKEYEGQDFESARPSLEDSLREKGVIPE